MATITLDGVSYPLPQTDDLTLGEMEDAAKMGAKIPTSSGEALDPTWVRALICIAKRRAGEKVDPEALKELRFGQIDWTDDSDGGEGDAGPPPNRAQRRSAAKSAAKKDGR